MRKVIGVALALLLALIGVALLSAYVGDLREEREAGEQMIDVYVLASSVEVGSSAADVIAASVLTAVPESLVAEGAVTDPDAIGVDLVSAVDMVKGEQVIADRFISPRELGRLAVPKGLQEITLRLEPERALGGALVPGSTVGVVISFDRSPGGGDGTEEDQSSTDAGSTTHLTLDRVLVTAVQTTTADDVALLEEQGKTAPGAPLLVTFAVSSRDAQRLVYGAEFGTVWLTAQFESTKVTDTPILAGLDVFTDGAGS